MTENISSDVFASAQILWDFHGIEEMPAEPVDLILALGSHDLRVADYAASLWIDKWSPWLAVSGRSGKVTGGIWSKSEAEVFADIARGQGVPDDAILVEDRSTNTGANFTFTKQLVSDKGVRVDAAIIVTKPYMRRRALATAKKQWPDVSWFVSAAKIGLLEYPAEDTPLDRMLNLMVGDLQRLEVYAEQGFQIPQEIPADVWQAWNVLVDAGYDQFVLKA